jgi:hypothetical protein
MNKILKTSFESFNYKWDLLQSFLRENDNPLYEITDDLDLSNREMESLGNLTSVEGNLDLSFSKIKSLGNLTSVGGDLFIEDSLIKSLENLKSVGGDLFFKAKEINNLGNLRSVGGDLTLMFHELSKKITKEEVKKQVDIGGELNIYLYSII